MGYYDYTPTITLSRPLALIGLPGTPYRQVGLELAALTGLPLTDLDRLIEHRVGQSVWDLVDDQGLAAYRQLQTQLLPQTLSGIPPGIVILGEGALLEDNNRHQVLAGTSLVYLTLEPTAAYWLLRQRWQGGRRPHPLLPQPLEQMSQLRPFFAQCTPGVEAAHCRFDTTKRDSGAIVTDLIDKLAHIDKT